MRYIFILLFILTLSGCSYHYWVCQDCNNVYRDSGWGLRIPSAHKTCRGCGGEIRITSKEKSGWNDEQYKKSGNEVPY